MIPINFPSNPANYNYVISSDFGSVYLLARAALHYGPENINVVSPFPPPFHFFKSVHTIADILGIKNVRTVTLHGVKPDFPLISHPEVENVLTLSEATDTALVTETLLKFLQKIEPEYVHLHEADNGLFSNAYGGWVREAFLALLIDAGIINLDLTINTTGPYKTLVMDTSQDNDNDLVYTKFMKKSYSGWSNSFVASQPEGPYWVPLENYNVDDILVDAKEMGIVEPLLAIHHCGYNRPLQCGICGRCKERRHLLIQAGIDDPTEYSFT